MRETRGPRLHLFVCANVRPLDAPLGAGCSSRGEAVYEALKNEVGERGMIASVWITKTHCLGICPKRGATVARYPCAKGSSTNAIITEVEPSDASSLLLASSNGNDDEEDSDSSNNDIAHEIDALHELQAKKVLDLARRLKPGLTLEDVQNPHDFPELDDPDWHYADGVLTGIASVRSALMALKKQSDG